MSDLETWLRAQLDADEQWARSILQPPADWRSVTITDAVVSGIARRQLAEADAKRRILDNIVPEADGLDMQVDGEFRVGRRDLVAEPYLGDALMRLLALPYADRPGYREEWRP